IAGNETTVGVKAEIHHRRVLVQVAIAFLEALQVLVAAHQPLVCLRKLLGPPPQLVFCPDTIRNIGNVTAEVHRLAIVALMGQRRFGVSRATMLRLEPLPRTMVRLRPFSGSSRSSSERSESRVSFCATRSASACRYEAKSVSRGSRKGPRASRNAGSTRPAVRAWADGCSRKATTCAANLRKARRRSQCPSSVVPAAA